METTIKISIKNILYHEAPENLQAYWAGVYLSALESLVYQNNIKVGFHKLSKKKLPLTLSSLKGNSNLEVLNQLFDSTLKNHSFEYLMRNMFNSLEFNGLFYSLIYEICRENELDLPDLSDCKYYVLGRDSITKDPEIEAFDFLVKTSDGFINDKVKIKSFMRHCDCGIEIVNRHLKKRFLFFGEIEGLNGDRLLKESWWVSEKKSLSPERCYHFGLGVTPTNLDLKTSSALPKQAINKAIIPIGKRNVVVCTFENVTNLPQDMEYALDDLKKRFNEDKFQVRNSLFSSEFYTSLKVITNLIDLYWNTDIRELLNHLRSILHKIEGNVKPQFDISLNVQIIKEGAGISGTYDWLYKIPPLEGTDFLVYKAKVIESNLSRNKTCSLGTDNVNVSSFFSGNFLLPREKANIKK